MVEPIAYIDESFREHDAGGFYVLAAAIFAAGHAVRTSRCCGSRTSSPVRCVPHRQGAATYLEALGGRVDVIALGC